MEKLSRKQMMKNGSVPIEDSKLIQAAGVLGIPKTPVYWYGMSAQLKQLIPLLAG